MQVPSSLVHFCHESLRKQLCADNKGQSLYENTHEALMNSNDPVLQDWKLTEIDTERWSKTQEIIFTFIHLPTDVEHFIAVPFKN